MIPKMGKMFIGDNILYNLPPCVSSLVPAPIGKRKPSRVLTRTVWNDLKLYSNLKFSRCFKCHVQ